jgi:acyl dehydratase
MSAPSSDSAVVEITEELIATLVERGGYVHPLFRPAPGHEVEGGPPLPGQGVLLLMGGLAEQSGLLDDAIALVEIKSVRFLSMLSAGMTLRVQIEPGESRNTSSGKVIRQYRWTGVDGLGAIVAEADVVMLMNQPKGK